MSQMGMDLAANNALLSGVWTKLTTWNVRSGFPSTVITNNTLVMDVPRTGTVSARVSWGITTNTRQQMRVVRNGTTVVLGPFTNVGGVTQTATVTVAIGDTLELQAYTDWGLNGTGYQQVNAGSTSTFLTFTYGAITQTIGGQLDWTWGLTADQSATKPISPQLDWRWGLTADQSANKPISPQLDWRWGLAVDARKGDHWNVSGQLDWHWGLSADTLYTPRPVNPPSIFTFTDVAASVHTADGRTVGHFNCSMVGTFGWARELTEVSGCTLGILMQAPDAAEIVEDLRPWLHWVTVWHDDIAVWTGPIQNVTINTNTATITAKDPATFMWRTRIPISRTWDETSPADIASILWLRMLELHGIHTTPVVVNSLITESFSLTAVADSRLLNQFMDDLVKVGLAWTVVAGRPVLGQFPRDVVAELADCDFMVEIERQRDGSQTFNDVRVQGQNYAQTTTTPLAGLHLQNLVSLDDVFGVSNIQKAASQYVARQAQIRDVLSIPASASLHPEAPVALDDLIPGKMFKVTAQGVTNLMRLDSVQVSGTQENFDVQVTLVADNPVSELDIATGGINL